MVDENGLPENFRPYALAEGSLVVDGNLRNYYVLNKDVPNAPRWFIGYNKGKPFISNEIPEDYRVPMIMHEIVEFEQYGKLSGRCSGATRDELKLVANEKKDDYIRFRIDVFKELDRFMRETKEDPIIRREIRQSISFLEGLL